MTFSVEATYEGGVLKPKTPLPLEENATVRIAISPQGSPLLNAYGIIGWSGDAQTLERIALDAEFDPQEDT